MTELIDPLPLHPTSPPCNLVIQVTNACNFQCVMCAYKDVRRSQPRNDMSMELYAKIIAQFLEIDRLERVGLSLQCEPLLDEHLHKRIQYVKMKKPLARIGLSTNAFLLSQDMYKRLYDYGLDALNISLNAVEENTFKAVCGTGYHQVMENTVFAIKNKPNGLRLSISSMLVRENIVELLRGKHPVLELIKESGIPRDMGPISNHCGSLSNYDPIVVFPEMQSSTKKLYCHDIFEAVYVLSNGDLIGCCSDWRRKTVLGNLAEHNFFDLWQRQKTAKRREQMMHGDLSQIEPCKQCSQGWNIMKNRGK